MNDSKKRRELSMDEILASIRKIISEEGEAEGGILELTRMVNEDGSVVDLAVPPGEALECEPHNTDKMLVNPAPEPKLSPTLESLLAEKLIEDRTAEDLIKKWLDDNLEGIVERLVKERI
ncbi:MAG: DUF2497 domain-containing protein [Alphaproteobacteria bacterium]|jgi:cell pole-organizing protein PopZ|nr:DUF2497 domain-containing protein [Alphaproteobacteria bacterium]MDP7182969.1 DUF2497 domain-containing protein [Alphaproteobacteria bacterium]MDP7190288.1 DUF2497 domain-containing protein [Alphaproteobacteria bacterium]|tara:strand:+ start:168 stop:527 length:360 start_codon:yes stop_codon:yes gene_type:complete